MSDGLTIMKVKHYIVKETGDPAVDRLDVVDRGWGELWMDFSKDQPSHLRALQFYYFVVPRTLRHH